MDEEMLNDTEDTEESQQEKKYKNQSSSYERSVRAYLSPGLYVKFSAYIESKHIGVSEGINDAVRALVNPARPPITTGKK